MKKLTSIPNLYIISKIGESPPKCGSSFPNRDPLYEGGMILKIPGPLRFNQLLWKQKKIANHDCIFVWPNIING